MNEDFSHFISIVLSLSFFIGSIPFGILIAKFFHIKNLREHGSGNIGATNVSRVLGFWPAGFLTFILDAGKGYFPLLLVHLSHKGDLGFWEWVIGLFTVLGHCFSPWLKFRGGKGVATGLGTLLFLSPWAALVGTLAFILSFLNHRIGALSSLLGLLFASAAELVISPPGPHLWIGALMVFIIVVRHESNIDALLSQNEKKF